MVLAVFLPIFAALLLVLGIILTGHFVRESRFEARRRRRLAAAVSGFTSGGSAGVSPSGAAASAAKKAQQSGISTLLVMWSARLQGVAQRTTGLGEQGLRDIRLALLRAGYANREALSIFLFLKMMAPLAGAAFGYLGANALGYETLTGVLCAAVGALVVSKAVDGNLKSRGAVRAREVKLGLPDFVDLAVICAESGLAADAALDRVSRELATMHPILAAEMSQLVADLAVMPSRGQAWDNLLARVPLQPLKAVVQVFRQSERSGTPVAEGLRVEGAQIRKARMLEAEERAARIPILISLPLILFLLPAVFIVLLGPAALMFMDAFKTLGL